MGRTGAAEMTNKDVLAALNRIADLLQLKGEDPFRVRGYQRAADTIRGLTEDLTDVAERGELETLPGIGKAMAAKIEELLSTGELGFLNQLQAEVPAGLVELLGVPELGPKTARKLYDELGVETIDQVEAAAADGRVAALKGFGKKSADKLVANIALYRRGRERVLAAVALEQAEPLLERVRAAAGVLEVSLAGSLRRGRETTKDIDILASAEDGGPAIEAFLGADGIESVTGQGETKASVRLNSGLNADLRVVPPASWGAALQYFTGSKEHNIAVRSRARERGLTINEYGVYRIGDEEGEPVASVSEEEVYAAVGLPWIAPELREDRGEVAAAEAGELPELISIEQMRGDLHTHTLWSDGAQTVAQMARAALERGDEYLAVCDHSKSLLIGHGLDEQRVREQAKEIEQARAEVPGIAILRGIEVDILSDGRLDLEHDLLAELDVVVASVHVAFTQDQETMTRRLLAAIETGLVDILGHPTGRLLTRREGFWFDFDTVADACLAHGVAMEINAAPERLDLDEVNARRARRRGLMLSINTDAHHVDHFDFRRFGISQARRAWLGPEAVINTMPLERLLAWLKG